MVDRKIQILKRLVLHINMGDIVFISTSTLAIGLWHYIKKVFRVLWFLSNLKKKQIKILNQRLCWRDFKPKF